MSLTLEPIGRVHSTVTEPKDMPRGGVDAVIELDPKYEPGLLRIEEHSHLWILSWFHLAERDVLQVDPIKMEHEAPPYGVFGLRAFKRPNPIALSLVSLEAVEGSNLRVRGLDAIDGTPVLDIKSYFERDCVFSPRAPVLRPKGRDVRFKDLERLAEQHHQERCFDLELGARMALVAEEIIGKLTGPELKVTVEGSRCLVDAIQGLTRARFSNPQRLTFTEASGVSITTWETPERVLVIRALPGVEDLSPEPENDARLFSITIDGVEPQ